MPHAAPRSSCICGKARTTISSRQRLRRIVKTYSDHIGLPIILKDGGKEETINTASALWTRPRSEITAEQYKEFYHHVGHSFDDPWLTLHNKAEGVLEYTNLLFVPSTKPFDLFDPERKSRIKLYVRRVFITDEATDLLPAYLRFLRGIVDSEDLPLNISREMLQSNPMVARIRQQLTRRVLSELAKKAGEAADEYAKFWDNFGAVLKEGLYEDRDHREELLGLARFRSTMRDELVSLDDYIARDEAGAGRHLYNSRRQSRRDQKEPAARRVSGARGGGPADDGPDRRVLGPDNRSAQGEAVQVGNPRRRRSRQDTPYPKTPEEKGPSPRRSSPA